MKKHSINLHSKDGRYTCSKPWLSLVCHPKPLKRVYQAMSEEGGKLLKGYHTPYKFRDFQDDERAHEEAHRKSTEEDNAKIDEVEFQPTLSGKKYAEESSAKRDGCLLRAFHAIGDARLAAGLDAPCYGQLDVWAIDVKQMMTDPRKIDYVSPEGPAGDKKKQMPLDNASHSAKTAYVRDEVRDAVAEVRAAEEEELAEELENACADLVTSPVGRKGGK